MIYDEVEEEQDIKNSDAEDDPVDDPEGDVDDAESSDSPKVHVDTNERKKYFK